MKKNSSANKRPQPRRRYVPRGAHLADLPTGSNASRLVAEDHSAYVEIHRLFLADGAELVACAVRVRLEDLELIVSRAKARRGLR